MRTIAIASVVAVLGSTGGCARPRSSESGPHQVRYDLEWRGDRVVREAGRAGWTIENDRGYRVRVERGYVVSRSVELVECPRQARTGAVALEALAATIAPSDAWAGHSSAAPNPAAITTPIVESLVDPRPVEAGRIALQPQDYCRVFYLVARASNMSRGLPADVDMVDRSLHVAGTYWAPGASAGRPFAITTAIANSKDADLFPLGRFGHAAEAFRMSSGETGARIVVRRNLDTLFDRVDFATMNEREVGRQILSNLVAAAEIETELRPAS